MTDKYYREEAYRRRRIRRKRAKRRKFTRGMRIALFCFFILFILAFAALGIRIYGINRDQGERYKKAALSQQSYTNTTLNYQRGAIKDRNNTTMAVSVRKYNLVLEPRTLAEDAEKKTATVEAIASYFSVKADAVNEVVTKKSNSMYEHLDELKELDSKKVDGFKKKMQKDKNIVGVWFEETYTRDYPLKTVGCNIIGFMSSENQGTYGVEEGIVTMYSAVQQAVNLDILILI
ncbi:MAG: hypothetical protein ACLSG9_10305 [Eubacterium sp.]